MVNTAGELHAESAGQSSENVMTGLPTTDSPVAEKLVVPPPHYDHDYLQPLICTAADRDAADQRSTLEEKMLALKAKVISLATLSTAKVADFKHYTGLPNTIVFYSLVRYLKPKAARLKWWRGLSTLQDVCKPVGQKRSSLHSKCKLAVEQQFFWVLFRLRRGAIVAMTAKLAGVSPAAYSKMFQRGSTSWHTS